MVLVSCGLLSGKDDRPDIPGKIVFSAKDDKGTSQIFTMNANGSGLRQLTRFGPDGGAADPAWSPDGRRIVFANYTGATTLGPYLFVMDADGDHMRPLKRMPTESLRALVGAAPAWSPDGTKIAYQVCTNCELGGGNYEISVVEVAGEAYDPGQVHAVTGHPAGDTHPAWSPDGQRIVFASNRAYTEADSMRYRTDLYVMNADGANLQRLTEFGFPGDYTWMDTDRVILTVTDRKADLKDLFILDVETGNKTPLMEGMELKAQLSVFWDSVHQQLLMVNKNHEELPVIIASYDLDGKILQQHQLNSKQLKSATGFNWYISEE